MKRITGCDERFPAAGIVDRLGKISIRLRPEPLPRQPPKNVRESPGERLRGHRHRPPPRPFRRLRPPGRRTNQHHCPARAIAAIHVEVVVHVARTCSPPGNSPTGVVHLVSRFFDIDKSPSCNVSPCLDDVRDETPGRTRRGIRRMDGSTGSSGWAIAGVVHSRPFCCPKSLREEVARFAFCRGSCYASNMNFVFLR